MAMGPASLTVRYRPLRIGWCVEADSLVCCRSASWSPTTSTNKRTRNSNVRPHAHSLEDLAINTVCTPVACFLMVAALFAKEPEDWKQGKLINLEIGSYSKTFGGSGRINTQRRRVFTYSIDAGDKIYQAEEVGRRNAKAIRVDVNGPVDYRLDKDQLYVRDPEGKSTSSI